LFTLEELLLLPLPLILLSLSCPCTCNDDQRTLLSHGCKQPWRERGTVYSGAVLAHQPVQPAPYICSQQLQRQRLDNGHHTVPVTTIEGYSPPYSISNRHTI
jgi:hypothetical protein